MFVRRRNTSDMAKVAGKALNKLAGSLFGGSTGADDGESLAQSRCRVILEATLIFPKSSTTSLA